MDIIELYKRKLGGLLDCTALSCNSEKKRQTNKQIPNSVTCLGFHSMISNGFGLTVMMIINFKSQAD